MYTIDDDNNQFDDDEVIEEKSWNNRTGLIVKIIIIILCVIVLIWLIKALKSNNNTKVDDGTIHASNVLKVRLAAEEYYFLNNQKEKTSVISIGELKSLGLLDKVVDYRFPVRIKSGEMIGVLLDRKEMLDLKNNLKFRKIKLKLIFIDESRITIKLTKKEIDKYLEESYMFEK